MMDLFSVWKLKHFEFVYFKEGHEPEPSRWNDSTVWSNQPENPGAELQQGGGLWRVGKKLNLNPGAQVGPGGGGGEGDAPF